MSVHSRSNWNLEMLVFEERGKPEYPEKNLSEQSREPTTNSTQMWRRVRESNPASHWWKASALTTAPSPCSRQASNFLKFIALSRKTTEKCPGTSEENLLTTYLSRVRSLQENLKPRALPYWPSDSRQYGKADFWDFPLKTKRSRFFRGLVYSFLLGLLRKIMSKY